MEFTALLNKRRSIRNFNDQPVEEAKLLKVLDSAAYAASAMNQQSWFFVLLDNKEIILGLAAMIDEQNDSFYGANHVILMFAKDDNIAPLIDTSLAASNMMYQACDLGLGTCWIHGVKEILNDSRYNLLKEKMGVPQGYSCIGSLAIGYYDQPTPDRSPRKYDYFSIVK
ncbi:MAG: nitroreductase family protein [Erysipelotrichaceae bacterium]|nr:nitroreductase family protein [Erysipelotrichaceae bacterium]MDY5252038.1 nitroreductase family protein [Erysipelotrichaceae bacterium]